MPALCRFYGLRPEDFDRMTFREVAEFRTQYLEWRSKNPDQ